MTINRLRVLFMTVCMLLISVSVYAQTIMTDKPTDQKVWEVALKIIFPAIWTALAPWITGLVTSGISHVPPAFRIMISSVLGAIMAGATGAIPDFPLTVESAATMGLASGGTGQVLANMQPNTMKPKTDEAQAVIDSEKKKKKTA